MRVNVAWLGVVVLFSFGLQAHAQSTAAEPALRVNVEPGPHYQDVAARLQIVLDGFEAEPPPQVDIGTPDGAEVEFVGTSPSVSSRIEIINGQMRQWKTVRHIFEYRVLPKRVGQSALALSEQHKTQPKLCRRSFQCELVDSPPRRTAD